MVAHDPQPSTSQVDPKLQLTVQTKTIDIQVLQTLFKYLSNPEIVPKLHAIRNPQLKSYVHKLKKFDINRRVIYCQITIIFLRYHFPGQLSINKKIQDILRDFYLYDMNQIIKSAISKYRVCLQYSYNDKIQAPEHHLISYDLSETVYIDLTASRLS